MTTAIGLLGGTFDPIHNGHLQIAQEIQLLLKLAQIRFIPCQQPVLKTAAHVSAQQRAAMVQLAIADKPAFTLDLCELQRTTPSYTLDTLSQLRSRYPNTPLCWIIGADALTGFTKWYRWQEIFDLAHLLVVSRPGHVLSKLEDINPLLAKRQTHDANALHQNLAGQIFVQPVNAFAISSTEIRRLIAAGDDPDDLLPEQVWQFIRQNKLYM